MEINKFLTAGTDVIYLAACALNDICPTPERILQMDLTLVYKQSARHSMQAITYMAINKYVSVYGSEGIDKNTLAIWKIAYNKILKRLILVDIEREKLIRFLEENGIWYMLMKGAVLQNYYSKLGMRQMSDNDILISATGREGIHNYMVRNGYKTVSYKTADPDTYKNDFAYFEMHHSLFVNTKERRNFYEYYEDVKSWLIRAENTSCGYKFTDEDFYVYFIAHAYKHFDSSGNGLRSLMDTYVYNLKFKGRLRQDYVSDELKKLGLLDFESATRVLAFKIFSPESTVSDIRALLSDKEAELLDLYITSGTFGTYELFIKKKLSGDFVGSSSKKNKKIKYFFRRMFPRLEYYKLYHPTAYRYKILIPGCWLLFIFNAIFFKRKKIFSEIKALWKHTE